MKKVANEAARSTSTASSPPPGLWDLEADGLIHREPRSGTAQGRALPDGRRAGRGPPAHLALEHLAARHQDAAS